MHIVVILRLVPDLSDELDLAEDGKSIDREWVGIALSEFDEQALEEAVLLKEAILPKDGGGAKVTAIARAGEGVERMLQGALARGADSAILLEGDEEEYLDSRATAPIFAEALRSLQPDLVLTGVQTIEDIFGQLAPYLGRLLDWPQVSAVSGVELGERSCILRQEYSGGRQARIEVDLPAVVGLQTASQPPRYVSASKLKEAMKSGEISRLPAAAEPMHNRAEIESLAPPDRTAGARMLGDEPEGAAAAILDALDERDLISR
ncbi:MAG: electron transfer flavoprotein subunit beta/FixA family protein [Kiloniellales bacterium]